MTAASASPAAPGRRGRTIEPKVPHVAAAFWAVKLLTTGMGEAASDAIAQLPAVLAGAVLLATFAGFVWLFSGQIRGSHYRPVTYWGSVAMIAVFGTMAADVVHIVLGNTATTVLYAVALAVVLLTWRRVEGSISIHSITTTRRELFYWATVAATFALGTAAGDFAADTLHLGYWVAALVFALAMAALCLAWRALDLPSVPVFWAAYVLTRPLGASIADGLGKPASKGHGLGLGDGPVALTALVVFVVVLVWLERSGRDRPTRQDVDVRRSSGTSAP